MWYTEDEDCGVDTDENLSFTLRRRESVENEQKLRLDHAHDFSCRHFKEKSKDTKSGLCLFGTVPPPQKLSLDQLECIASGVADSIKTIRPDAVMIYDIQDERSRDGTDRPFPFFNTHEPRLYAQLLDRFANCDTIVYRAMFPGQGLQEFSDWIAETLTYGAKHVVIVGGTPTPNQTVLSVPEATKLIAEKYPDIYLGGIIIPERHRDRGTEHQRIIEKVDNGISFFTSQVVYNADNSIALLRDYDELCKKTGKEPIRLVFTFAPFGSDTTVKFLKWLGVELPEGTMKRVLSRPNLKARVEESVEICWENWKRILDASRRMKLSVPIGFSVESVSKSKMEQEAAVQLFEALREEMDIYYQTKK